MPKNAWIIIGTLLLPLAALLTYFYATSRPTSVADGSFFPQRRSERPPPTLQTPAARPLPPGPGTVSSLQYIRKGPELTTPAPKKPGAKKPVQKHRTKKQKTKQVTTKKTAG